MFKSVKWDIRCVCVLVYLHRGVPWRPPAVWGPSALRGPTGGGDRTGRCRLTGGVSLHLDHTLGVASRLSGVERADSHRHLHRRTRHRSAPPTPPEGGQSESRVRHRQKNSSIKLKGQWHWCWSWEARLKEVHYGRCSFYATGEKLSLLHLIISSFYGKLVEDYTIKFEDNFL